MPDCNYCSGSFDSEEAYLKHLRAEHESELGRIDRRRVEDVSDESDFPKGPLVLGAILLAVFGIVGYLLLIPGSDTASGEPTAVGSVHEHGTMEIAIAGESLDLTSGEFTERDSAFHFHDEQSRQIWHTHAQEVTLQYALDTLGIEVNDEGTVLSYDGETYRDNDPDTEIGISVDGEPVEPGTHVLRGGTVQEAVQGQGDDVRIVVETDR